MELVSWIARDWLVRYDMVAGASLICWHFRTTRPPPYPTEMLQWKKTDAAVLGWCTACLQMILSLSAKRRFEAFFVARDVA